MQLKMTKIVLIAILCPLAAAFAQELSPITVVEFSDFQCPYCQRAATTVQQLRQMYCDNIQFVFKQMPLPMHAYAFKAAEAAVLAEQQGKFWEYHDRLFASNDLSVTALKAMARQIGLNTEEFNQGLDSETIRPAVEKDIEEARQLGVTGTPTFLVEGKVVKGGSSLSALTDAINQALTRSTGDAANTIARNDVSDECSDAGAAVAQVDPATLTRVAFTQETQAAAVVSSQSGCAPFPVPGVPVCSAADGGSTSDILTLFPATPSLVVNCSAHFAVLLTTSAVQQCDLTSRIQQWTSSNPSVATFDASGAVVGVSPGTATITAFEGTPPATISQASTVVTVTGVSGPTPTPAPTTTPSPTPTPVPAPAVSLSASAIDFGYQLVGSTSPQFAERITNSGTAPLIISKIDVPNCGDKDFTLIGIPTLPLTLAPANSVTINLSFTPAAPWRPGTRHAKLGIKDNAGRQIVPLRGIGATCGGPLPACSSGCADTDGDGLNDEWEIAGGIDVDNNGKINRKKDPLLPGADPNKPDIYVQYDWMDYGLNEFPCTTDLECTNLGVAHVGDTCTGPATPQSARTCVHACAADTDCTALGPSHTGDRCVQNVCEHTHDPEVLSPGALQAVSDAFAAHGFNLHILRGHAVPHSHVVSFNPPQPGCEGAYVPPGTLGAYAVNFYDLKQVGLDAVRRMVFHYTIFGHYSSCDSDAHCGACPTAESVPNLFQTGIAELPGNDFIVSLGHFFNDQGGRPTITNLGGTFMHELGHNLGLHHGGGTSAAGTLCVPPVCEDAPLYKPNYLSVMNYSYQQTGILEGDTVGSSTMRICSTDSDCATGAHCVGGTCTRLDYSIQTLPTGGNTPGALTENGQLNEPAGLGSGRPDIFTFNDGLCGFQYGAAEGPVDWDGDGLTANTHATADLNQNDHLQQACGVTNQVLAGHTDWGPAPGQSIFTMAFQCTPNGLADGASPSERAALSNQIGQGDQFAFNELSPEMAAAAHVLYPPRPVHIEITPGHANKIISPGRRGVFSVALLGSDDLDVREVEASSVNFHGATPVRVEMSDINGDGKLDLVVSFDMASVRLHPQARKARLTGWLKNSQAFIGEDQITVIGP
jgi:predicted DsbA family dithiol-disulfide isomerase